MTRPSVTQIDLEIRSLIAALADISSDDAENSSRVMRKLDAAKEKRLACTRTKSFDRMLLALGQ